MQDKITNSTVSNDAFKYDHLVPTFSSKLGVDENGD